jgi:hypothetical protein
MAAGWQQLQIETEVVHQQAVLLDAEGQKT